MTNTYSSYASNDGKVNLEHGREGKADAVGSLTPDEARAFAADLIRSADAVENANTTEQMYLVCNLCGEAFDSMATATSHSVPDGPHEDEFPEFHILPESEAM